MHLHYRSITNVLFKLMSYFVHYNNEELICFFWFGSEFWPRHVLWIGLVRFWILHGIISSMTVILHILQKCCFVCSCFRRGVLSAEQPDAGPVHRWRAVRGTAGQLPVSTDGGSLQRGLPAAHEEVLQSRGGDGGLQPISSRGGSHQLLGAEPHGE